MEDQQTILFDGQELTLQWGSYAMTNHNSLQLVTAEGEPFMTASTDVEHVELEPDEILIKNYSQNEGILPVLIKAGIVAKPHESVSSGYVEKIDICQVIN